MTHKPAFIVLRALARARPPARTAIELARRLTAERESERERIARELHDELGALWTSARLELAALRTRLGSRGKEVRIALDRLDALLASAQSARQRVVENQLPPHLHELGLRAALEGLCDALTRPADLTLDAEIADLQLERDAALAAYRIVQEAVTNVVRHARARHVRVRVWLERRWVVLAVADDGVGFEPVAIGPQHQGLAGVRQRVQAQGGVLRLEAAPGAGTHLQARWPLGRGEGAP